MLEVEDVGQWPMEVVRDVRRLLEQLLSAVRQDSPGGRPPEMSTANSCEQAGQATATRVCPSAFTRRYRSCSIARSAANMPSMTPVLMAGNVPSDVITRDSSSTVRYASLSCTRG